MNKFNNPRLLNTVISGTGMKHPVRPHVIIGSEEKGFIRGDLMDANAIAESIEAEVNERMGADSQLSQDIDTKINQAVENLVNGAPEVLDTLKELSDALGDDENFANSIATELSSKVDKVEGKGLSTNDYTNAEKTKLSELQDVFDRGTGETSVVQKGTSSIASGAKSIAVGLNTTASGANSHAEGNNTIASGINSHAEGAGGTEARGEHSHAEGWNNLSSGDKSHSEGEKNTASGVNSHVGGFESTASGKRSFAHGYRANASGENSISLGTATQATKDGEMAVGRFNISDSHTRFSVGIGTADNNRKNAFAVTDEGKVLMSIGGSDNVDLANAIETTAVGLNALGERVEGIAEGAEVNVQSDWLTANPSYDSFIKNKPTKLSQFQNDTDFVTADNVSDVKGKVEELYKDDINVADILYSDGTITTQVIGNKIPIGICVGSSSDFEDGKARFISLKYMSTNTAEGTNAYSINNGNAIWFQDNDQFEDLSLQNYTTNTASNDKNGESNNSIILDSTNADHYSAVVVCKDFDPGYKQGDWYLPAVGELAVAYSNKITINRVIQHLNATVTYGAQLEDNALLSSTESSSDYIFTYSPTSTTPFVTMLKYSNLGFGKAVRAFLAITPKVSGKIADNEEVVSTALNNLNIKIEGVQNSTVEGFNYINEKIDDLSDSNFVVAKAITELKVRQDEFDILYTDLEESNNTKYDKAGGTISGDVDITGNTIHRGDDKVWGEFYLRTDRSANYIADIKFDTSLTSGNDNAIISLYSDIFEKNPSNSIQEHVPTYNNATILRGIAAPVNNNDAATKKYVDDRTISNHYHLVELDVAGNVLQKASSIVYRDLESRLTDNKYIDYLDVIWPNVTVGEDTRFYAQLIGITEVNTGDLIFSSSLVHQGDAEVIVLFFLSNQDVLTTQIISSKIFEKVSNKKTSITSNSTSNDYYPTTKAVYDEFCRKPVTVWEYTDGTKIKASNTALSATPTYQITGLDFTPYKRLKFYIAGGTSNNNITPTVVLEMPLDSHAANSDTFNHYTAGYTTPYLNNDNRLYTVLMCVSSDKTSVFFSYQTSLYGTAGTSAAADSRYLYKIEGLYD